MIKHACLQRFRGFTLAEVLITLGIIGVVASMTIPTLIQNYQEKSLGTAKDVFQKKINVALKTMVTQQELYGYSTTADFVNDGLSKHMKIIKTCPLDELDSCFAERFTYGTEEIEVSDITDSDNMGQDEWETKPIGVVFANGVSAILLYNNNCSYIDPYDNTVDATACVSMAYDVNGLKTPNSLGKDLATMNATLSKFACISPGLKKSAGICVTKTASVNFFAMEDCLAQKERLGLQYCWDGYNGGIAGMAGHWGDTYAGLVAACGGIDKVASLEQLAEIAKYVYETDNIQPTKSASSLTYNPTRWEEIFGSNVPSPGSAYYFISNKEAEKSAYERNFGPNSSQYTTNTRGFSQRAICVR